ncbi:MAG: phosphoribosylformylglycinamidine synthase I [Planctomycetes bacterium]|nr:phosphoribosylformylglycinamidine synthase I [Planctomycetota bacterium]
MATIQVLVLRAPGTNCDGETAHAFELAGARPVRVHVNALLQSPGMLAEFQVLVIPGGFSYGDDVAAGKILANQLRIGLGDHLRQFRDGGKLILGICNGFQVLMKSGLLPGWADAEAAGQQATLAHNDSGKFEDRWIHLVADPGRCPFLQGITSLDLPIAHGEGKFVCRDDGVLEQLRSNGQIVLRYAPAISPGALGQSAISNQLLPYPINPNGSQSNIAGICDPTGRVLGLMPHPERHVDYTQYPHWTRRRLASEGDGLALFRNAVRYFG